MSSRTEAQRAIDEGRVTVGGISTPKPASMVGPDDPINLDAGGSSRYVSRGGLKLEGALDAFGIDPRDCRCLDAGASTGGFTDCLLQRGAASVTAVDVGYGQLAWSLQQDARVEIHDRTNLRNVDPDSFGVMFDVIVADLSFISLCAVAGVLARLAHPRTDLVLLVKPQFELGKGQVGKGGIVREADDHARAIRRVIECLDEVGLGTRDLIASPVLGAKGNREFLIHVQLGNVEVGEKQIEEWTQQ